MSLAESDMATTIPFDHKRRSQAQASSWHVNAPMVFQDLAMPLFDSLYNFAHWLTQNREDAEDLVQETYVKALKGFESFQLGTNFRAWIFQILRNTFLSSRARLEFRMTVPLSSEEDSHVQPVSSNTADSLLIGRSDLDSIRCAIEQLPVAFREAILLCDVEEMPYREIAETLSIPIGTVMSRIARARKQVRDALGKSSASVLHGPTETEMTAEVE
jgi:RNA polymerase sigma-70 factor (ECF subfamily)